MEANVETLTTDACPTPPRPATPDINQINEEESCKIGNPAWTKKTKPHQTVANVINISNSNGIHIGTNYTFNMGKSQKMPSSEDVPKTKGIIELLESPRQTTQKEIATVAAHVGEGWRDTVRCLDYSQGQIDQFYEEHIKLGVKEVVYQILLDWIQNEAEHATIGRIATALWNTKQRDVVNKLVVNK